MNLTNKEYSVLVDKATPPSKFLKNMSSAFLVGGTICCLGQALQTVYVNAGATVDNAKAGVSVTLIVLTIILTGYGIFDKIARFAGAGTIVPITGFANSVVSPAIEFKSEGQILGLGAKMFILAGPVLVFGISSSIVYGLVLWIFQLL